MEDLCYVTLPILSNFANFMQKHAAGNLAQTHVHSPSRLILCVRTVPCKN